MSSRSSLSSGPGRAGRRGPTSMAEEPGSARDLASGGAPRTDEPSGREGGGEGIAGAGLGFRGGAPAFSCSLTRTEAGAGREEEGGRGSGTAGSSYGESAGRTGREAFTAACGAAYRSVIDEPVLQSRNERG